MKRMILTACTALLCTGMLWAAEDAAPQAEESYNEVFAVLEVKKGEQPAEPTLGTAVDTFDRALDRAGRGEVRAVESNLAYNRKRLVKLRKQKAAHEEYVRTFWERMAVYFDNLKAQYGDNENAPEYRKAVISLKEEYEQREAAAKRELDRLSTEVARTEARIAELENRGRIAKLEQDLRGNRIGGPAAGEKAETEPAPSRADEALAVMENLSTRKTDKRVLSLLVTADVRSASDDYFEKQIQDMVKGK